MSATEYLTVMPEWEVDLLLSQVDDPAPVSVVPGRPEGGAFSEVPDWLRGGE